MKKGGYHGQQLPDATIPDLPPTASQRAAQIIPKADDSTIAAAPWLDPKIEGRLYPVDERRKTARRKATQSFVSPKKEEPSSAVVEVEPTEGPESYVSPWRYSGEDLGSRPFPDEYPDVTVQDLAEADERQMEELVERYGSSEGVDKALDAQKENLAERHREAMARGGYGNQPWEKGPGVEAYGKSVQDVGDALGWVPHPAAQVPGTGLYVAGAAMQGKGDEVAGGLAGAALGAGGRQVVKSIADVKKFNDLTKKFGPDVAEILIDQGVQEVGEN